MSHREGKGLTYKWEKENLFFYSFVLDYFENMSPKYYLVVAKTFHFNYDLYFKLKWFYTI